MKRHQLLEEMAEAILNGSVVYIQQKTSGEVFAESFAPRYGEVFEFNGRKVIKEIDLTGIELQGEDGHTTTDWENALGEAEYRLSNLDLDIEFEEEDPQTIEIMSASEAEELWGLKEGTVRSSCTRGPLQKLIEKGLVRQSGKVWLVTEQAMREVFGDKEISEGDKTEFYKSAGRLLYFFLNNVKNFEKTAGYDWFTGTNPRNAEILKSKLTSLFETYANFVNIDNEPLKRDMLYILSNYHFKVTIKEYTEKYKGLFTASYLSGR